MPAAGTTNTLEQSMSKQSEAKAAQGYTTAVSNCGNCAHMGKDLVLPAWMLKDNEDRAERGLTPYTIEQHGVEKNFRCGIGGFAIKKTAACKEHKPA